MGLRTPSRESMHVLHASPRRSTTCVQHACMIANALTVSIYTSILELSRHHALVPSYSQARHSLVLPPQSHTFPVLAQRIPLP